MTGEQIKIPKKKKGPRHTQKETKTIDLLTLQLSYKYFK